jgi:hypothetical protein
MKEPDILYSKEGFIFTKNEKNNYSISFQMENNNIILSKIIDFNLIRLIYDLNKDIYEKVHLQIINDSEATANLLMKHLFEELGLPQRFSYLYIKRIVTENSIIFNSQTITSERPEDMPDHAVLMPIQNMIMNFDFITPHKTKFTCNIFFENTMIIPAISEKLVGFILYKIFNRVKQFIENVRL